MNQYNYSETSGSAKKDSGKPGFHGASYAKLAKSATLGTIIGVFSSVILMIIFAVIINAAFGDPDSVIGVFTCIAASAGAAIGGFYASKLNGSKGFVSGITTGLIISLVILTIMAFSGGDPAGSGEDSDIVFNLVIILCQIIFACAGGVFAVNSYMSKKSARSYSFSKKK
jgi:putative membrane protein (TIGR04086 family)